MVPTSLRVERRPAGDRSSPTARPRCPRPSPTGCAGAARGRLRDGGLRTTSPVRLSPPAAVPRTPFAPATCDPLHLVASLRASSPADRANTPRVRPERARRRARRGSVPGCARRSVRPILWRRAPGAGPGGPCTGAISRFAGQSRMAADLLVTQSCTCLSTSTVRYSSSAPSTRPACPHRAARIPPRPGRTPAGQVSIDGSAACAPLPRPGPRSRRSGKPAEKALPGSKRPKCSYALRNTVWVTSLASSRWWRIRRPR